MIGIFRRSCAVVALLALSAAVRAEEGKPDTGKFVLTIQESEVGSTTFTADKDGNTTYDEKLDIGGQKITSHVVVKAKGGIATQIEAEFKPGGKLSATLDGAKSKFKLDAKSRDMKLPAKPYLFDNFAPHLLTPLLAAYDAKKGGTQKFDLVLVNAGVPLTVSLSLNGTKNHIVGGAAIPVTSFQMIIPGGIGNVEIEVLADSDSHVLMWNVSGQKYLAVREGYAELAKLETPADPLLSKPTFKVKKDEKVMVKLRDGVALATDIYRPDAAGNYPVILQRTPYGRKKGFEGAFYARRGYVFVVQDVRGKFDSEGKWEPFVNEARDGYDAVEWCAAQPWSNGKVGMIGGSYLGFVQWAAAREGSEHLKCLVPIVSPPDPFFNIPYAYGALFFYPSLWWAAIVEGKEMATPAPIKKLDAMKTLPLTAVDKKVFGHTVPFFQDWLKHPTNDSYWEQVNFNEHMKTMKPIPALHVSGWFDGDGIGTKRNYGAMVAAGQPNQRLMYGPWEHAVNTATKVGELDFGPQSLRDLDTLYLRWFDRFLKDVANGVDSEPPVEAFLMGTNEWRKFSAWPPAEAEMQKWYFHSGGKANGSAGNGKLSLEMPSAGESPDRYDYNPAKPYIPASFIRMEKPAPKKKTAKADAEKDAQDEATAIDSSADEKDRNKLVYSTETLANDVIVAGPISVHLTAATSAKDTDWYAYLADVTPEGKSLPLAQGILRARFRKSFVTPELLTPNETADYEIDLWALGNVFRKGHKIRVVVTSSCFPIYDRNLNTGEDIATSTKMVTAHQTVFHDNAHASYITLPVLPK